MHRDSRWPVRYWVRAVSLGVSLAGLIGIVVAGTILVDEWYARWMTARLSEAWQRVPSSSAPVPAGNEPVEAAPRGQSEGGRQPVPEPTVRVTTPSTPRVLAPRPVVVVPTPVVPTPVVADTGLRRASEVEASADPRPKDAPTFQPGGPVHAVSVPRLGIRTEVVETAWEPPNFVAGQIRTTAGLGEGNSVVVGHRSGRAGNVFARLLSARLGDVVVAASHGGELRLIVSDVRMLPGADSTPIGPTDAPRVTLMTCIGAWNPLTGDYSHRLWVIAEPLDLARATLAATAERARRETTTSSSPADAARARADAALARLALLQLEPERRARP